MTGGDGTTVMSTQPRFGASQPVRRNLYHDDGAQHLCDHNSTFAMILTHPPLRASGPRLFHHTYAAQAATHGLKATDGIIRQRQRYERREEAHGGGFMFCVCLRMTRCNRKKTISRKSGNTSDGRSGKSLFLLR